MFWRDKRGATERSEPISEGGSGVLPRNFSKNLIANGANYVIPELYLWILLAYIVIKLAYIMQVLLQYSNCNTKLYVKLYMLVPVQILMKLMQKAC